ncbi:hypothetical protein SAMN05880501_104210 [Ureibacillus xyleni]|uniref:Uncharacterized protein n=1 Tax=Ureibacillus xyleni TaxID=614648 RepID=A0A285SE91_9BACL|nr:hypothetical protein [Ureibacillus xyleni]SOC06204.1 hypothetical protein SAMN05880501_104210 [Ureibacillus xyleni]
MYVKLGDKEFCFHKLELEILDTGIKDTFAKFDKKTMRELLRHRRYEGLKSQFHGKYEQYLDIPAGKALYNLKSNGDPFYKQFLNNYGDLTYSHFAVKGNETLLNKTGVYTIVVDDELVFTGVCANSFKLRFNQHIGNISPKCCFKDGTATHCHINAKITDLYEKSKIQFKICPMNNLDEMKQVKNAIINRFEPIWNIRFSSREESYIGS